MLINGLSCKLISRKGHQAEIEIEGQKIVIPSEYLPSSISDGENCQLYFTSEEEGKTKEKKLARAILEEILNGK